MNTKLGVLIVALALLTAPWAVSQELLHARLSYGEGAMVKGTAEADWSLAPSNTLIMPGDTVWVDKGGMAELEMSGGTFLRMADGSKAEIVALPPSASVRGWTGACSIQRIRRSTGDVTFETPACAIQVQPDSQVRFDVVGEGATTVSVRWGRATVRSQAGGEALSVLEGRRVYVDMGCIPSLPVLFDRSIEDSFDAWNRERASALSLSATALPPQVAAKAEVIGVYDLAPYGEWVYVDNSPYWRPTMVVDYCPYRQGYWSYVPSCGNVWVGQYPFCYVTSHYGRWTHHVQYGWIWNYTDVWSPAWVASFRYGSNLVWCPLDPWDHPVMFGEGFYSIGGLRLSIMASSYCPVSSFYAGPTYGLPCSQPLFVGVPETEINIWNIYIGNGSGRGSSSRNVISRLYPNGSPLETRDYSPRRAIRGFETGGANARSASERIAVLERDVGYSQFTSARQASDRVVRTPSTSEGRTARLREVAPDLPRPESMAGRGTGGVTRRVIDGAPSSGRTVRGGTATGDASRRVVTTPNASDRSSPTRDVRRETPTTRSAPSDSTRNRGAQPQATPSEKPRGASRRTVTETPERTRVPSEDISYGTVRTRRIPSSRESVRSATPNATPSESRVSEPSPERSRAADTSTPTYEAPRETARAREPQVTVIPYRSEPSYSERSNRSERVVIQEPQAPSVEPPRAAVRQQQAEPVFQRPMIVERSAPEPERYVQRAPEPERHVQRAPEPDRAVRQPEPARSESRSESVTTPTRIHHGDSGGGSDRGSGGRGR